jgi:hypothetical protein
MQFIRCRKYTKEEKFLLRTVRIVYTIHQSHATTRWPVEELAVASKAERDKFCVQLS